MHGRSSDQPQQWSVHAQFTISHPGIDDPNAAPQTHTERDENGVRMFYTWTSQPSNASQDSQTTASAPGSSVSTTESVRQPLPSAYGFQRGNMMFTSVPPRRPFNFDEPITSPTQAKLSIGTNVQDSGYNSELLSPNSLMSGNLLRKPVPPYNRRCRSTCSIVLSTTINEQPELEESGESVAQQTYCGRTQSLRCQTPTVRSERSSSFYGCGDPWCYHSGYGDDGSRISPGQESVKSSSTAHTISKQSFKPSQEPLQRIVPEVRRLWEPENRVKDAAVQTLEMVDKCTSPYMKTGSFCFKDQQTQDNLFKKEKTLKKRSSYNSRSRTEPVFMRTHSPSSFTPDSLESLEVHFKTFRFFW
ncbi:hypothetical protein ILUMI_07813 [Ignelater luminosus]|uniref:Uncharacterized protein n=1 Tax=Ignelater luminosus TaxID=2038154 RepID=A0A8K0GE09_IGNLU|nr:hypothetical protein ILUMI_07813 [Ignelater luminosus]